MEEKEKKERAAAARRAEGAARGRVARAKREITALLKAAGWWREELAFQVEMAAADLVLFRQLRTKALSVPPVVTETRRDGPIQKPHPLIAMMQAQANQVRQDFKALSMNYDSRVPKGRGEADGPDLLSAMMGMDPEEGSGDD